MGDPAGVGPEILIKALNDARVKKAANVMAVGDLGVLREAAKKLRLKGPSDEQVISVTNLDLKKLKIGKPSKLSGEASVAFIEEALYMTAIGDADAFVTCPISKEAVKKAGFTFPGHTEFIAHLTGTEDFVDDAWRQRPEGRARHHPRASEKSAKPHYNRISPEDDKHNRQGL